MPLSGHDAQINIHDPRLGNDDPRFYTHNDWLCTHDPWRSTIYPRRTILYSKDASFGTNNTRLCIHDPRLGTHPQSLAAPLLTVCKVYKNHQENTKNKKFKQQWSFLLCHIVLVSCNYTTYCTLSYRFSWKWPDTKDLWLLSLFSAWYPTVWQCP